jgi:uncharacterized membrane protein HdeD (DUF308 family)
MHKVGIATVWAGLLMSVLGLIFGAIDLVKYGEASIWIAMVPAGFALLLLGTAVTQFSKK